MYAYPFVPERHVITGTFRPDRIKSIADRFGVNGDMALGKYSLWCAGHCDWYLAEGPKAVLARAYNSEHQVKGPSIDSFWE
jgi:hypothetical protein